MKSSQAARNDGGIRVGRPSAAVTVTRVTAARAYSTRGATPAGENSSKLMSTLAPPIAPNHTSMSIGWRSADHKWGASIYGTNLFDKRYATGINGITAATFGTPIASVNTPRQFGIDLHAAF